MAFTKETSFHITKLMLTLLSTALSPNMCSKYGHDLSRDVCKYFKKRMILKWLKNKHIFSPLNFLFLSGNSVAK